VVAIAAGVVAGMLIVGAGVVAVADGLGAVLA
jgi:hypothetical protein